MNMIELSHSIEVIVLTSELFSLAYRILFISWGPAFIMKPLKNI